jgi:predicted  nucleic acid-binding Zn-ribbon protein
MRYKCTNCEEFFDSVDVVSTMIDGVPSFGHEVFKEGSASLYPELCGPVEKVKESMYYLTDRDEELVLWLKEDAKATPERLMAIEKAVDLELKRIFSRETSR